MKILQVFIKHLFKIYHIASLDIIEDWKHIIQSYHRNGRILIKKIDIILLKESILLSLQGPSSTIK